MCLIITNTFFTRDFVAVIPPLPTAFQFSFSFSILNFHFSFFILLIFYSINKIRKLK